MIKSFMTNLAALGSHKAHSLMAGERQVGEEAGFADILGVVAARTPEMAGEPFLKTPQKNPLMSLNRSAKGTVVSGETHVSDKAKSRSVTVEVPGPSSKENTDTDVVEATDDKMNPEVAVPRHQVATTAPVDVIANATTENAGSEPDAMPSAVPAIIADTGRAVGEPAFALAAIGGSGAGKQLSTPGKFGGVGSVSVIPDSASAGGAVLQAVVHQAAGSYEEVDGSASGPLTDPPLVQPQSGVKRPSANPLAGTVAQGVAEGSKPSPEAAPKSYLPTEVPEMQSAAVPRATSSQTTSQETAPAVHRSIGMTREVAAQIADGIVRAAPVRNGVIITLRPEELGKVEVVIRKHEHHHAARILVDRQETLDLIRSEIRTLERSLVETGIDLRSGSLELSLRGQGSEAGDAEENSVGGYMGAVSASEGSDGSGAAGRTRRLAEGRGIKLNMAV